jgi:dTMP kinase
VSGADGVRGRLIVLEGGEGCGKSTQAELLARHIGARLTREPGGTPLGERIRSLVLDPDATGIDPRAETLLLLAARAEHVAQVVSPTLAAGEDVVCDRFSGSTLAYQGYGRGLELGELGLVVGWAVAGLEPDLVLLLTVEPEEAARRRQARGGGDRIDGAGEAFHRRVAAGFRALAAADPGRWRVVDGAGPVEEVARRVAHVVDEAIPARG